MDILLHGMVWNAIMATVLAIIATLAGKLSNRPALTHVLWILVFVKLLTPSFIPVSIPGYSGYQAAS